MSSLVSPRASPPIEDRLEHVAGLLAIAAPETLASAGFQAVLRRRLAALAAELRGTAESAAP